MIYIVSDEVEEGSEIGKSRTFCTLSSAITNLIKETQHFFCGKRLYIAVLKLISKLPQDVFIGPLGMQFRMSLVVLHTNSDAPGNYHSPPPDLDFIDCLGRFPKTLIFIRNIHRKVLQIRP
jgi:hypothetical protein